MRNTADSFNLEQNLGLLIHLANQFKDQLISNYFSPADITAAQFKVLISVYKGFTSPGEIRKNLMMDAGAMSRMIERMVKRDLIQRFTNPQDKRQVILALSEKGHEICRRFQHDAPTTIISQLTARLTDEESHLLAELLSKMLPENATQSPR
ncbi:MarR family transcriptional regulator [Izhakiella australiensis]|uniref:MarR family transcriptional regulator n=1 Tax=Izhakiella australiensis TaxID=1926881 RepID=A0A1S8YKW6_9GAMM|nr:MarR family transcriptional regulator [Izhakiella australiensis]OON39739.1 MarR family transcriptional regulator [Izhakiella australiensis]